MNAGEGSRIFILCGGEVTKAAEVGSRAKGERRGFERKRRGRWSLGPDWRKGAQKTNNKVGKEGRGTGAILFGK